MEALCAIYRTITARAGKAEPIVHIALTLYALLLIIAIFLNVFYPAYVSRNVFLDTKSSSLSPDSSIFTLPPSSSSSSSSSFFFMRNNQIQPPTSQQALTISNERAISQCLSRGLLLDMIDDPVVSRVRSEMDCGCALPEVYEPHESPNVAAIIQSFNHVQNVEAIANSLISNPAIEEIIVCEDGSTDGSLDKWTEVLRGVKHFIIVSNNLHEVRCYNRAMRLTSASLFILLQDDDVPPPARPPSSSSRSSSSPSSPSPDTVNWVAHAKALFDSDSKLGALSGFIGQLWDPQTGKGFEFGEQTSDHGGKRQGATYRIPFIHTDTRNPFMYVECAWAAPLFIRAEALNRVGGLDVGLFGVREPGVWQDCVLSYATWTAGWRVGVYDSGFQRGVGGHGSTSTVEKSALRDRVWERAKRACDQRYDRHYIHSHVLMLNNETLVERFN